MANKNYRAYNFDLDTKKLKENFKNYTDAYKLLENSFKKYGVAHRQGSGYVTTKKITTFEAVTLIKKLSTELKWLSDCVKKFDVTNVGETYDLTSIIHKNSNKATSSDKIPESITNKLVTYQRDNMLRGEVAAAQTLNDILDRPFNSIVKVNAAQNKKASDTAAKRSKKSKDKGKV